jgi:hypothetical protein
VELADPFWDTTGVDVGADGVDVEDGGVDVGEEVCITIGCGGADTT